MDTPNHAPLAWLYLHGFASSPRSMKAQLLRQAVAQTDRDWHWQCPQLPVSPREAAELAETQARAGLAALGPHASPRQLVVAGSSLGGFYATALAERLNCQAVVINPVVDPVALLASRTGKQAMYHSPETFVFKDSYIDELAALKTEHITEPQRYFLIAATGDELLDWRDMRDHYAGCAQRIVTGGDHALSNFAQWLPDVLAFATYAADAPDPQTT